ncbi:hypothetical protein N1031_17555 [Herbiconiux moechotypicola]|uniref:Uncharacterized protein n=1 Tax=Herbiconiux moechotypicola TaxID=637393 RepID=A0ABP5QYL5_9MICO|nr:hypothetical protein [Herbiconiux moechotypicola]MCS5731570.1 hypothetical protein [Herbiconiux moechotypicola]
MGSYLRRDAGVSAVILGVGALLTGSAFDADAFAPDRPDDLVGFYQRETLYSSTDAVAGYLAPEGWETTDLGDSAAAYAGIEVGLDDVELELKLLEEVDAADPAAALGEALSRDVEGLETATTASGLALTTGWFALPEGHTGRASLVSPGDGDTVEPDEAALLVVVDYPATADEERVLAAVRSLLDSVEIVR